MSASQPSPLPAHLRPILVEIPATWTPEQALAVFELLDEIKEKIWALYVGGHLAVRIWNERFQGFSEELVI
jgi:hypothetical protein